MKGTNRYEKAGGWLKEPEAHIHSVLIDENTASAVVIGETGEYVVAIRFNGELCSCAYNRFSKTRCSHLIFFSEFLKSKGAVL